MNTAIATAAEPAAAAVELFDLPHDAARAALATGAPAYLTVNPVEYHGPHLSLHNDRLLSRGLVARLHAKLAARHPGWPLLVGADLEVGVEPCVGLGTRTTPFPMVRRLVLDACAALVALGAQRVVLMTFHGAPLHNLALEAGVAALRAAGVPALAPFHWVLRELLELDDPARFADALAAIPDPAARARAAAGLRLDFHAGFFETSMALHLAPASVSPAYRALPPCPPVVPDRKFALAARAARRGGKETLARELEFAAAGLGWNHLDPFPGYTGEPALAEATAGAAFTRHMIDGYAELAESVLVGGAPPPPPIMPWVEKVSLGGRLRA